MKVYLVAGQNKERQLPVSAILRSRYDPPCDNQCRVPLVVSISLCPEIPARSSEPRLWRGRCVCEVWRV